MPATSFGLIVKFILETYCVVFLSCFMTPGFIMSLRLALNSASLQVCATTLFLSNLDLVFHIFLKSVCVSETRVPCVGV